MAFVVNASEVFAAQLLSRVHVQELVRRGALGPRQGGLKHEEARADALVEADVTVTLERREQHRQQRLEPLPADAV